jgi:phage portal protein BeeE
VFGVPSYKIGVGPMPTYNNVEALDSQYYSQCLQIHIEQIELCLDEGLGLAGSDLGTVFDLDGLLRMDTETKVKATSEAIKAGFMAPNEARAKFDLKPVEGGESPYLQIQNYSLKALSKRDKTSAPTTPGLSQGQASPKPTPAPAAQGDTNAAAAQRAIPRDFGDRIERAADRHTRRAA